MFEKFWTKGPELNEKNNNVKKKYFFFFCFTVCKTEKKIDKINFKNLFGLLENENIYIFLSSFQLRENHPKHTHTHTYIYIYIYICVCVCVCVLGDFPVAGMRREKYM